MTEQAVVDETPAEAGQAPYTRFSLALYDLFVMNYTLPVLWRCSKKRLRRLYGENASGRHLDIGVGSGYLLRKCEFPTEEPEITLMDMNPNSLAFAARRIRRYSPGTHQANVLEPWGLGEGRFDSIGMANLLHCVPGSLNEKGPTVFAQAERALAPGGTVFGATVLGTDADHTKRSAKAMERLNERGAFSNLDDRRADLETALADCFDSSEVEVEGAVALFAAGKAPE